LALALFALVVACWGVVAIFGTFPGDREVAADVAEERLGWWGLLPARILDWLGEPVPAAATVAAIAVGAAIGLGWRAAVLVVAAAGASAVTYALKLLFDRERPPTDLELDPSFPSGHTAFATAVFGLAALMLIARGRWLAALGALAIVAAMGPSRLLLGVHWTSDVLAGYAVGLAWLTLVLVAGGGWAWRAARRGRRATA
jgi:undecaprenyl-diphosphatase